MFEIGFWELVVIAVVALIVIGPERLPGMARTAGLWIGRAKRMIGSVREDIEREIKAEELRKIMERQAQSTGLHEIIEEGRYTLKGLEEEIAVGSGTASAESTPVATAAPAAAAPIDAVAAPAPPPITTPASDAVTPAEPVPAGGEPAPTTTAARQEVTS